MVNHCVYAILLYIIVVVNVVHSDGNDGYDNEFLRLIGRCSRRAPDFDRCMKGVFNDLRVYFPTGEKVWFQLLFLQELVCTGFGSLGRG